jgi:hypothetical protein
MVSLIHNVNNSFFIIPNKSKPDPLECIFLHNPKSKSYRPHLQFGNDLLAVVSGEAVDESKRQKRESWNPNLIAGSSLPEPQNQTLPEPYRPNLQLGGDLLAVVSGEAVDDSKRKKKRNPGTRTSLPEPQSQTLPEPYRPHLQFGGDLLAVVSGEAVDDSTRQKIGIMEPGPHCLNPKAKPYKNPSDPTCNSEATFSQSFLERQ